MSLSGSLPILFSPSLNQYKPARPSHPRSEFLKRSSLSLSLFENGFFVLAGFFCHRLKTIPDFYQSQQACKSSLYEKFSNRVVMFSPRASVVIPAFHHDQGREVQCCQVFPDLPDALPRNLELSQRVACIQVHPGGDDQESGSKGFGPGRELHPVQTGSGHRLSLRGAGNCGATRTLGLLPFHLRTRKRRDIRSPGRRGSRCSAHRRARRRYPACRCRHGSQCPGWRFSQLRIAIVRRWRRY